MAVKRQAQLSFKLFSLDKVDLRNLVSFPHTSSTPQASAHSSPSPSLMSRSSGRDPSVKHLAAARRAHIPPAAPPFCTFASASPSPVLRCCQVHLVPQITRRFCAQSASCAVGGRERARAYRRRDGELCGATCLMRCLARGAKAVKMDGEMAEHPTNGVDLCEVDG